MRAKEDLDHLLWGMQDLCGAYSCKSSMPALPGQRDVRAMTEEFILHLPFEKGCFLWLVEVCDYVGYLEGREMIGFFEGRIGPLLRYGL